MEARLLRKYAQLWTAQLEPTFDAHGYPTDETLAIIENWPHDDWAALMEFVSKSWHYPEYARKNGREWSLATGGWSGNESIIYALGRNFVFWRTCWVRSERGGHYVFEVPEGAE